MKQRITLALTVLLCTLGVIRAQVPFSQEDGYYLLSTPQDLVQLSALSNDGATRESVWTASFKLTQDIDMSSIENFTPIGFASANTAAFKGTFDGQGHTISNLTITTNESNANHLGFIGLLYSGTLRNLCLKNVTINNNSTAPVARGAMVGRDGSSTIENCCVINFTFNDQAITETGTSAPGGVVGYLSSSETSIFRNNYAFQATRVVDGSSYGLSSFGGKGAKATLVTNNYDDTNAAPDVFASGKVCYLLNGSQSDNPVWYQTLGEDASPVLDATHQKVYLSNDLTCDGATKGEPTYGNSGAGARDAHTLINGICTVCGNADPAWIEAVDGSYPLGTPEQLEWFAALVNGGYYSANAFLVSDIDLSGVANFTPIGLFGDFSPKKANYSGTFDGRGHIISNLTYTTEEMYEAGLFSRVYGGTLKNLGVVNASLTSNHHAASIGVLAGYAPEATFINCWSAGAINLIYTNEEIGVPIPQLGGIAGNNNNSAKFINCWSTYSGYLCTGGGSFTNCFDGEAVGGRLESGELTWLLNGQSFLNPTWFQTIGSDTYPVLDATHRIVYKIGDEFFDVGNDDSYPTFRSYIVSQESDFCEQAIATQALLDTYQTAVNSWNDAATLDIFLAAYGEAQPMRDAIAGSVREYQDYVMACQNVRDQLASMEEQNSHRLFLEDYLDTESEIVPGEYPNGNIAYILATHTLTGEELKAEKEYVEKLLLRVVLSSPSAGSEMTVVMNNPDFSAGFSGWTVEGNAEMYHGGTLNVMHVVRGMSGSFTVKQTLQDLPNGIYKLCMNGFTRTASDVTSKLYTADLFMNDVANPLMAIGEDPVYEADAQDGVNCHITGSDVDVSYYDEINDASGYVPAYLVGCSYAFNVDRYLNRMAVEVTDGTLTLGVRDHASTLGNWSPFANARLYYLGTAEEANESLTDVLECFVARAITIRDFVFDEGSDYAKRPNMSSELRDQIAAAIEESQTAATGVQKMDLIKRMSKLFSKVYTCRMVYINMLKTAESLVDLSTKLYRSEMLSEDDYNTVTAAANEAWDDYIKGSLTEEQARECIAALEKVYGDISLPIDEAGFYHLSTPRHLIIFSSLVNEGEIKAKAVVDADIDMSEYENFTPIGFTSANGSAFQGTLDGQGHTISGVTINIEAGNSNHVGFIGLLYTGTVRNLCLKDLTINNNSSTAVARGGMVGRDGSGTIENCCVVNFTFNDLPIVEASTTAFGGVVGYLSSSATSVFMNNYAYHTNHTVMSTNTPMSSYGAKGSAAVNVLNNYDSAHTTDEQFASGEITYLLNGSQSEIPVWYQTLGEDVYPLLTSTSKVVYKLEDGTYSNEEPSVGPSMPVADLLDVVFHEDGTAEDVSPMHNTVEIGGTTAMTYFNETYQRYVARFDNPWGGTCTGFYKVDFENNDVICNALANGHTLEVLCMADYEGEIQNAEAKPFSAMQAGGTGFLISKTAEDRQNELTFLPNVTTSGNSTWQWVTSGVVPESKVFYHIVGVWDAVKAKTYVYVNGELKNTLDSPGQFHFANAGCNWFAIGGDPANASSAHGSWHGDVGIARAYDKPLTQEEVTLLWNSIPTGIKSIHNSQFTIDNDAIYDLTGRRVQKATKGIYIQNRKKILVK